MSTFTQNAIQRISTSVKFTEKLSTNLVYGAGGRAGAIGEADEVYNYTLVESDGYEPPTPIPANFRCRVAIDTTDILEPIPNTNPEQYLIIGRGWGALSEIQYPGTDPVDWRFDITDYIDNKVKYTRTNDINKTFSTEVLALTFDFDDEKYKLNAYDAGGFVDLPFIQRNLSTKNNVVAYIEINIPKDTDAPITVTDIVYTKTKFEYVEETELLYNYKLGTDEDNKIFIEYTGFNGEKKIKFNGYSGEVTSVFTEEGNEHYYKKILNNLSDGQHTFGLYLNGTIEETTTNKMFSAELDGSLNSIASIPLCSFEVKDGKILTVIDRSPTEKTTLPVFFNYLTITDIPNSDLKININNYTIYFGQSPFEFEQTTLNIGSDNFYAYVNITFDDNDPTIKFNETLPNKMENGSFNLLLLYVKTIELNSKREIVEYNFYENGWHDYYAAGIWG